MAVLTLFLQSGTPAARAGAPEPDLVRYGKVSVNGISSGRVHRFNLDGICLASVDNPAPDMGRDCFGGTMASLDDGRFVVGALYDSIAATVAGSVYGSYLTLPWVELGSEIPRPDCVDATGVFPTQGPGVSPAGSAFWHVSSGKLFAVKPGHVRVTWPLLNNQTNNWEGVLVWPSNASRYQIHIAGQTAVDLGDGQTFSNVALHATSTDANPLLVSRTRRFGATVPGDSFIMLSAGEPTTNAIRFQFIRSIAWNNPAYLHDNVPAVIGQPIADPADYSDPACGSPQVVQATSVYCPAPVFDPATRTGTIIPVNRDNPDTESDDLVVAFYQRGTKLYDPVTGAAVANNMCWPAKPVRYRPEWPAGAPKIIIASEQGTGVIDPAQFVDWELYFQNDSEQAGFNPNDEHALRRPVTGGEALFALRDDLGTAATSEPYVLIRYRDPAAGLQWRMKVWRVVAEEAPFFFRYPARVSLLIHPPFPLDTLPNAPETAAVSGPYWRDRRLFFWARSAGDDGGPAEIVMRYFYPMQPCFFFPGEDPPPVGANVPLLDRRAGTPGVPINVRYDATWPESVPELCVGETLVKPRRRLPN